jgi:RHS repeat-associated protein
VVSFRSADPHKIPIDPNGNLTSKTEGTDVWTYTWNALNQLTKVEKNGAEVARLAYDPEGRRVEKLAGGVTTTYTYAFEDILREVRAGATLKYVHGPDFDEPLAVDDGTTLSYFDADGLDSVVKVTDAFGAVTLTRQYDAWGNLETGGSDPGHAFTGRERDLETGLYYYRARYYDAKSGRFISEDPIGLRGGDTNYYAYVHNNPVRLTDPSGLQSGAAAAAMAAGWAIAVCEPTPVGEVVMGAVTIAAMAAVTAQEGDKCRKCPKKRTCWNIGSGGCTNNAGKPGAPPGLSKRCNYACDDGFTYESYVPCKWKGDTPPCPPPIS